MPAGAQGEKAGWGFGPLGNEPLLSSWAPVHPGESHRWLWLCKDKARSEGGAGESWEW